MQFASILLLTLIVFAGFSLPRPLIPDYWIWAFYVSPLAWALQALVINEMSQDRWGDVNPNGMTDGAPQPPCRHANPNGMTDGAHVPQPSCRHANPNGTTDGAHVPQPPCRQAVEGLAAAPICLSLEIFGNFCFPLCR